VFCDVYLLRHKGVKLPRESLVGMRGRLRVARGGRIVGLRDVPPHKTITATVHTHWPPHFPGQAAATLYAAAIVALDERGLVLTGREVVRIGFGIETVPQAWYCRPVADPGRFREPAWSREAPHDASPE
jgi:hypothetical protein